MIKNTARKIIDRIFKEPGIKYELTEFEALGEPIHEILDIQAKTVDIGRDAGKTKYFLKSQVPFSSGKEEINEIFKFIFAKIWDESEARENRNCAGDRQIVVTFRNLCRRTLS